MFNSYFTVKRLFLLLIVLATAACSDPYEDLSNGTNTAGKTKIIALTQGMDPWSVSTRADNKNEDEKKISSLQLLIFDNEGKPLLLRGSESNNNLTQQWYQSNPNGSFLIDMDLFSEDQDKDKAFICLVANVAMDLSGVKHIDELRDKVTPFSYQLPKDGLPMYGEVTHNLEIHDKVININLRALIARIDFEIKLKPSQQDGVFEPTFHLENYDLCNFPAKVRLQELPNANDITAMEGSEEYKNLTPPANIVISEGSEPLKFHFYMGEHRRLPNGWNDYPLHIDADSKQRYKPQMAQEDAAKVVLRGFYTDHQGKKHKVEYSVYLGANHTDNFMIFRNKQYKNNITISGITNRNDHETPDISLDHRVNVTNDEFLVSIERETQLDCHIEIRPMDIILANEEAKVEVEILNPGNTQWVRLEKSPLLPGKQYCQTGSHKGKRLYFTTDLVTNTLAGKTVETIYNNRENRIWLYFDENPNASKEGMRNAELELRYFKNKTDITPSKTEKYTFKQHDLYPVIYAGREYYIEYFEEYLYNFDPKDNYGDTTDGMKWEQKEDLSIQLSTEEVAIYFASSGWLGDILASFANGAAKEVDAYYDFDNTKHPYSGLSYTQSLINKRAEKQLSLEKKPRSAAEYCYNKNKRDANGNVIDPKWYLPGTDEIEDIVRGGFVQFETFQNKFYWSSQPAFVINDVNYKAYAWLLFGYGYINHQSGTFYQDDKKRARCAKVDYDASTGNYKLVTSESRNAPYLYTIINNHKTGKIEFNANNPESTGKTIKYDEGNRLRSEINRVRAVRIHSDNIINQK